MRLTNRRQAHLGLPDSSTSQVMRAHLHILVSACGLQESEGRWVPHLTFSKSALMHIWRFAVITYLRSALKANVLTTDMSPTAFKAFLVSQYERWWNIDIHNFTSKEHFSRYAGRYARRPPIAQRRLYASLTGKCGFGQMICGKNVKSSIVIPSKSSLPYWASTCLTATGMQSATSVCWRQVPKGKHQVPCS
jgi:putative transposase